MSFALLSECLFLPKNDTRRAVLPICEPTTCVLAPEVLLSLRAFWRSDGDALRKPTTTFRRLLALSTCSDARIALSATRASLSASSVSRRDDAAGRRTLVRIRFPIHVPVGVAIRALALKVVLQRRHVTCNCMSWDVRSRFCWRCFTMRRRACANFFSKCAWPAR